MQKQQTTIRVDIAVKERLEAVRRRLIEEDLRIDVANVVARHMGKGGGLSISSIVQIGLDLVDAALVDDALADVPAPPPTPARKRKSA